MRRTSSRTSSPSVSPRNRKNVPNAGRKQSDMSLTGSSRMDEDIELFEMPVKDLNLNQLQMLQVRLWGIGYKALVTGVAELPTVPRGVRNIYTVRFGGSVQHEKP